MRDTSNKKMIGWIAFIVLLLVSLAAGLIPVNHPEDSAHGINAADTAWMLTATALVLIMTPGLSFFYGGMIRPKNIISTMLQSFVALGVISIVWYVVGFSLAFGKSFHGFIGNPATYFMMRNVGTAPNAAYSATIPFILYAAFQLKFAIITPALITGSFAERIRFWGYLIFMVLFSLFIYCPIAHWTWNPEGIFHRLGVLDFAGGTVVHMSAGVAALAGAMVLGRRKSLPGDEPFASNNTPYVILGTGLLWFGWFGFNAGSALAASTQATDAFVNTNLASAAAMLAWMLYDVVKGQKPGATGACVGAVVGLVAITPAAGYVTYGQSILIGVTAAVICNLAVHWKNKTSIDDTLDVFPCHGVGGMAGMILTGIFANGVGLIHGNPTVFIYHLTAVVVVFAYTFAGSWVLLKFTNAIVPVRVTEREEIVGLDITQHSESTVKNLQLSQQLSFLEELELAD